MKNMISGENSCCASHESNKLVIELKINYKLCRHGHNFLHYFQLPLLLHKQFSQPSLVKL